MDVLRDSPLPDDRQWLTGELHASHALLSNECDACHVVPFEPARDQECLTCHENVTQHFDADLLGSSGDVHANGECRDCHRDHNGNPTELSDMTKNFALTAIPVYLR